MSIMFDLRAVIEHPGNLLEEVPYTVTANNSTQAKNHVFEDCLKDGLRLVHLEIVDKREIDDKK